VYAMVYAICLFTCLRFIFVGLHTERLIQA